jgi:ethanolamine transporter EutH
VALFPLVKDMGRRGAICSVAFAACAGAAAGDHLGYTAAAAPHMVFPVTLAKLVGGAGGLLAALLLTRRTAREEREGLEARVAREGREDREDP